MMEPPLERGKEETEEEEEEEEPTALELLFDSSGDEGDGGEGEAVAGRKDREEGEEEEVGGGGGGWEEREVKLDGDVVVRIAQQRRRGIGFQLWPAAEFLCEFLITEERGKEGDTGDNEDKDGRGGDTDAVPFVVELGAGVGLVGLCWAEIWKARTRAARAPPPEANAQVLLTDLPEVLDATRESVRIHTQAAAAALLEQPGEPYTCDTVDIDCVPLRWGEREDIDEMLERVISSGASSLLVLAADCVYWEHLFPLLAETLAAVARAPIPTRILLSHTKRWKRDAKFFKLCAKAPFRLQFHVLKEVVSQHIDDFTNEPRRQVMRVYSVSALTET